MIYRRKKDKFMKIRGDKRKLPEEENEVYYKI